MLEHLKAKHNINYHFVYPSYRLKNIARFCIALTAAMLFRKKHSVIIFQKIYTTGIYATLLKMLLFFRRKNTVYDIDDAEYLRFSDKTIKHFLCNCSAVFVGSNELLNYVIKYNKNTFLLTSPVLPFQYNGKEKNQRLTIGWIGDYGTGKEVSKNYSHKASLKSLLFPAIKSIEFSLKLILVGVNTKEDKEEIMDYFSGNKNLMVEIPLNVNWLDETVIHHYLEQFDIGVSPMVDHEFNRAKSAFKLKQNFSCGIPALASPVGENNTFLKDGINGFLCSATEDFKEKILIFNSMSEDNYCKMSRNAANSLPEFDLEQFCIKLLKYAEC